MEDPKTPTTPGNSANFTDNETKLICAIMQNLTSEIQFDVEKVALELGYKNGSSLRARWNSLKRTKIAAGASPSGGVDKNTPSKKAKRTPKKAKATGSEDDEETPAKKSAVKKTPTKGKKAKGVKVEVKSEEEENALESIEGSGGRAVTGGLMGDDEGQVLPHF
ncbi:hypothetical protein Q7P36_000390 [Cladosporium allicinum]